MNPLQQGKKKELIFILVPKLTIMSGSKFWRNINISFFVALLIFTFIGFLFQLEKGKSIVTKYAVYFDNLNGRHQVIWHFYIWGGGVKKIIYLKIMPIYWDWWKKKMFFQNYTKQYSHVENYFCLLFHFCDKMLFAVKYWLLSELCSNLLKKFIWDFMYCYQNSIPIS